MNECNYYLVIFSIPSSKLRIFTYIIKEFKVDVKNELINACREKFHEDPYFINIYRTYKNDLPPKGALYVDFTKN